MKMFDNSNLVATHAACGCQRVSHKPKKNEKGVLSDYWQCEDCGTEFVSIVRLAASIGFHEAEIKRLTALLEHSINLTDNETLKTYSILKNELASCYDPGEHELMTALVSKFVQKPSKELTERKRYSNTFCSQCGVSFGPGNSGYSHCADHEAPPTKDGG